MQSYPKYAMMGRATKRRDRYDHQPRGVCSRRMTLEVEEGVIRSIRIQGGCDGNLQGISRLVEGMEVSEAIRRLDGIRCGGKPTSCPDQLAQALKQYKGE